MNRESILVATFQSLTATSAAAIGQLGYKLSEELHKRQILKSFIVSSKGKFTTSFPSLPVSFLSKYYLFILNNIAKGLSPYQSRYIQEYFYDRFCSFHLDKSITKLVVTTPYLYYTFKRAKELGIRTYFIPGNPEDNYIADIVKDESKRYGIEGDDAYTYKPRLDYYNKSLPLVDRVITFSSVMEETYRNAGYQDKILNVKGYLKPVFDEQQIGASSKGVAGKFKVSFLAYIVLLKGLQYVLEAWKDLQYQDMELHIGGEIDANVQKIIDEQYAELKNVYYYGKITDIGSFFKDKSIYVLPSLIDGSPVSVLEAMQSGIPSIVSENCGTKDILEEDKSGWIIPIRSAECIKNRILEAFHNPEQTRLAGEYAKAVITKYEMNDFVLELTEKVVNDN